MSKSCQKVVQKVVKSCQKVVQKLSKVVKKLSNSCQKVFKKLSQKVVTIGQTLKPKTRKTGKFERRSDQESPSFNLMMMMEKRGIRRLDATLSHLVTNYKIGS
jgi:hypothetical protein